MMKVMLLIHADEAAFWAMPEAERGAAMGAYAAYSETLIRAGAMAGGERLRGVAEAVTLRLKDGAPVVLDGPYAETREQLGGFYMLDVPDMDAAIQWAAKCPALEHGTVELRPVFADPQAA